jgi:hypothetical protein
MKSLKSGDERRLHPSGQTHTSKSNADKQSSVTGNERITALAGAILLVLIVVELVSAAILHTLMSIHVFAGVLLAGPLIVKLGSIGWRFMRYYTGSPAFVRRGPPHLALRLMAPLLIVTTLVVIGSGIGLVVTGPGSAGLLLPLHGFSVLVWLPLIAIHTFAHILRVPRLVKDDWSKSSNESKISERGSRFSVNLGALLAGLVAAILLFPGAAPWAVWSRTNEAVPAPMILGLPLAIFALLFTRPWKLEKNGG